MAATGEECYYQKPIIEYYDFEYAKIFDAQVVHYCALLDKDVVPAQCCGTICPSFKPLVGIPRTEPLELDEGVAQAVRNALIRKRIQHQLYIVCDKMRDKAQALEQENQRQERQRREADEWLGRAETQPDALDSEIVEAEQEIATIREMQARTQRELRAAKAGHSGARDFTELWLEVDEWAMKRKRARERKECAEATRAERVRIEREHKNLLDRAEVPTIRISLLMQLRAEVDRCVKTRLADTETRLTDADCDRMLRFLREVARYAADNVSIADLKAKVEEVSQGDSTL